jgi:FkbM family methyltransferase
MIKNKMIKYLNYNENRILYKNESDEIIEARIEVYENYTNSFMFSNNIDLYPYGEYFTYIPYVWKNISVNIYDRNNNELLNVFKISGNRKLNHYDDYGYLSNLFKIEKTKEIQRSLNDVIGEHFYTREYENFVDVEENDIVFDIGFNYGIFSLGALYKKAYKVYGFEPNIEIYNKIKNIYPEKDKVELFNYAVSDENKKISFYSLDNTVCSTISKEPSSDDNFKEYEVQCINLYDFIVQNNIEKIDFLKIDCEGEEYKVFESIPDDYFSKIRKIILEFHFNDGNMIYILTDKLNRTNFDWKFSNGVNFESEVGLIFAKNKNN